MYQFFIGIDISKDNFVVALHGQKKSESFENNKQGFNLFCKAYSQYLPYSLIILETTGGYEKACIAYLQKKQFALHRANTRNVKSFIRSYGIIGKSDSIDAFGLALYGVERHKKLKIYVENPHQKLLKLVQRRNDIKKMLVQEKNRLQAPDQIWIKKSIEKMIKFLTVEMSSINSMIEEFCKEHDILLEMKNVLKTIEGIGDITSVQLIALLPELGKINRKQIASLAGVAPHPCESGKKIGHRFTRGGRIDIKSVLFIAAMTAARSKSELGQFYNKLVNNGKKKMVALTALMRKILVIANARVRDQLFSNLNLQHG